MSNLALAVPITIERAPARFAGAAAIRSDLVIITVERSEDASTVVPELSAQFVLNDHRQKSLARFQAEVHGFLEELRAEGIDSIVLRAGQRAGKFAAGPLVHRMEAVLELAPGIDIRKVHHNSLRSWTKLHRSEIPAANQHLPLWEQDLQQEAIAAACLSYALQYGGPVHVEEVE